MTQVKIGPELLEILTVAYEADTPVLLIGGTGVGKSQIIEQAAAALRISYLVRDLSIMEAVDLAGLPTIQGGRVSYAAPSFLPIKGKGFLVFEELNRSHRSTRAPCLQMLTTRTLNDYKLPSGWLPVASINPPDANFEVEEMDAAIMARFMKIHVKADAKHWLKWASAHGVHEVVQNFVGDTPKVFDLPESNPRAWKYVSDFLHVLERKQASPNALLLGVSGHVGEKLGTAFCAYYRNAGSSDRIPGPEQLLSAYPRYRKTVQKFVQAGNTAALDAMCRNLLVYLQDPENEEAVRNDDVQRSNLGTLHADLPAEHRRQISEHQAWLKGRKGAA